MDLQNVVMNLEETDLDLSESKLWIRKSNFRSSSSLDKSGIRVRSRKPIATRSAFYTMTGMRNTKKQNLKSCILGPKDNNQYNSVFLSRTILCVNPYILNENALKKFLD